MDQRYQWIYRRFDKVMWKLDVAMLAALLLFDDHPASFLSGFVLMILGVPWEVNDFWPRESPPLPKTTKDIEAYFEEFYRKNPDG